MRTRRIWPWAGVLAVCFVASSAADAWAAIPAVVGPIQALIAILPQLMAMLGAALVAMLKPGTYKVLVKYLWTHKVFTIGLAGFIWFCVWGCGKVLAGGVLGEQVGAAWSAFRGGPERTGAVRNADGPDVYAKVAWRYQDNNLERVDSSPCVVGNRVYVSTGTLRLIGDSTGAIYCRDADKGGEVWRWTERDIPDDTEKAKQLKKNWSARRDLEKLKPIFSSPSVGGYFSEPDKDGKPVAGRYLVVGEGYHTDWNSRVICLDLEPVKTGKSKTPRIAWYKQTTCHVESSPSIHDGRVYVGSADDGVWCVDLETGETKWHLEGTPAYYVTAGGPKTAELEGLVGKFVKAEGIVERKGPTITEPGEAKFEVTSFSQVDESYRPTSEELNLDDGQTFRRVVVGRVTAVEKAPMITVENKVQPLDGISKVSIVPAEVCIDIESSPVAVTLKKEQAHPGATRVTVKEDGKGGKPREPEYIQVFFGLGFGGEGVACADGETGKVLWRTPGKLGFPVYGSPTVAGDKVIIGMGNGDIINDDPNPKGEVRCYATQGDGKKAADGSWSKEANLLWKFEARNTILGSVPVYVDEKKGLTLAYACSRDKNLYVLNVNDKPDANGKIKEMKKLWIGSKMVCSPAVTNDAVYLTTDGGRVVCVNRDPVFRRWSFPLCPGQQIISSPAVAGGKLFVGSVNKGVFGLINDPAGDPEKREAQPWAGQGGTADRGSIADEMGLPGVSDQKAPRMWAEYKLCKFDADGGVEASRTMEGPVAACGKAIYLMVRNEQLSDDKPYLARINLVNGRQDWIQDLGAPASALAANERTVFALVGAKGEAQKLVALDSRDGKAVWGLTPDLTEGVLTLAGERLLVAPKSGGLRCLSTGGQGRLWELPLGQVIGSPAACWNLIFVNIGGDEPRMVCLSDAKGETLWSARLPGRPVGPPAAVSVGPGQVYAACAAPEGDKGVMFCVRLTDGVKVWSKEIPGMPAHYPVASEEVVAVAGAKGLLYAFAAADGRFLGWDEGRQPIPGLQAPALAQGTVLFAGEKRVSTWNAPSAEWPWFYKDQGVIGKALAPPVVACETAYIVTEKRGLVAVAPPPTPRILDTGLIDREQTLADGRRRMAFQCREEANGIKDESVRADLYRLVERNNPDTGEKETVAEKVEALVEGGLWKVACPELKAVEGQPAIAIDKDGLATVTFTSSKPLAEGSYEVKVSVASRAGARTEESWKFVVLKEGAVK